MQMEIQRRGVSGNLNREIERYARTMERFEERERARKARQKLRRIEKRLANPAIYAGPVVPIVIDKDALRRIIFEVSAKTGYSVQNLLCDRRNAPLVRARHEVWWRARNETQFSLPQIATAYNRDHTTIIHGIRMHEKRMAQVTA